MHNVSPKVIAVHLDLFKVLRDIWPTDLTIEQLQVVGKIRNIPGYRIAPDMVLAAYQTLTKEDSRD